MTLIDTLVLIDVMKGR